MMEDSVSADDIGQKIDEFSQFIRERLRPERDLAQQEVDKITEQIEGYRDLLKAIRDSENESDIEVDVGHGKVFAKAKVKKKSNIFVHVGMGFHVELEKDEVPDFVNKRIEYLTQVANQKSKALHRVEAHIQSSSQIIDQLNSELEKLGGRAQ